MRTISLGYEAREQFIPFHKREQRWSCIVAHRRAGKTVACVADLIDDALRCQKPNPRFAYVAPYYSQAKDIAWTYLKEYGGRVPGAVPNETELRLDFPNGGRVRLYGADNYDRLRGLYFDGIVLDEYADMDPRVWPQVIRPALSDRNGWAVFIGTPKGHNDFFRIWDGDPDNALWPGARRSDDWFSLMLKASETGIVAEAEMKDAQRMLSEDEYLQEYECSFEAAIKGAFYGEAMKRARLEGRIAKVPYDRNLGVWTAWDLGVTDATAIWFGQTYGFEERIIDYYEGSGVGLDHYVKVLKDKDYNYIKHHLPHDVEVKELTTGISRRATLQKMGMDVTVTPMHSVMDGINATRRYLDRCWFDEEKTRRGVEALTQYRREFDEKNRAFRKNPLHDWTSHASDALRYRAAVMDYDLPRSRQRYSDKPGRKSKSWMAA